MSADPPGTTHLAIASRRDTVRVDMTLTGDLDIVTVPQFLCALRRIAAEEPAAVVCDLARLTFCDAAGVDALLQARTYITARGNSFRVTGAHGIPLKILTITDTHGLLTEATD